MISFLQNEGLYGVLGLQKTKNNESGDLWRGFVDLMDQNAEFKGSLDADE
mgnify:CR=1 FL=1